MTARAKPPAHRRADDQRRAERREELIAAAIRAIRREGPDASMEALAAEAGITKPILYRHFGDRKGVVEALAGRFSAGLMDRIRPAMTAEGDPRTLLSATVDAYLAFVEDDPQVYRFLVHEALGRYPESHAVLTGFIHQVAAEVATVLDIRLRQAGLDAGAAQPWAYALVGMVHFAGDWWMRTRTLTRSQLVCYLVDLAGPAVDAAATRR